VIKISLAVATLTELVNTTTSKANKHLRRSKILQTKFIQSSKTEIDEFYFDGNIFWQKRSFDGKNYFCQTGFYHGQKRVFRDVICRIGH